MIKKLLLGLGILSLLLAPLASQAKHVSKEDKNQALTGLVICLKTHDSGLPTYLKENISDTPYWWDSSLTEAKTYYAGDLVRYDTRVSTRIPGGVLVSVAVRYTPDDIIPPNHIYYTFDHDRSEAYDQGYIPVTKITASQGAQNWDKEGKAIWENGCNVPDPKTKPQK